MEIMDGYRYRMPSQYEKIKKTLKGCNWMYCLGNPANTHKKETRRKKRG